MNIVNQIEQDLIQALKDKDNDKVSVLRMVKTALKNEAIEKRDELTTDEAQAVLKREIKQRKDAIASYSEGGRSDLAQKEESEILLIKSYLPEELSEEVIAAKIDDVLATIDDKSNFGAVMGKVMGALKGQADGAVVRGILEKKLHQ